jgi:hypothetical protein
MNSDSAGLSLIDILAVFEVVMSLRTSMSIQLKVKSRIISDSTRVGV